jgi:phage/plasmid primase-like uncharacterized protein
VCTCGNWPDGIALISAVNDWTFKEALSEIGGLILGDRPQLQPVRRAAPQRNAAREDTVIRHRLMALWNSGMSLKAVGANIVWEYLASRGLRPPNEFQGVRFHPTLAYYEKGALIGHFPGFLACVQAPDGTAVTLHRTYLTEDGQKAPVEAPKKLCGHASDRSLQGAAIRLFPATDTIGVAEGIETALAVTEMTGIPCWSTMTAGLLAEFVPPPGIRSVTIYADKDRPSKAHPSGHGQEAARTLAERLWKRGIRCDVKTPPFVIPDEKKGIDWLDVLAGLTSSPV